MMNKIKILFIIIMMIFLSSFVTATVTTTGTITSDGDYAIVKFISGGTFETTDDLTSVSMLLVGGGGGGASGGGGAGGFIYYYNNYTMPKDEYTIVIGAGGLDGVGIEELDNQATNGGNTTFSDDGLLINAIGGGFGAIAGGVSASPKGIGGSGGAGGGRGEGTTSPGADGILGQGYAGGGNGGYVASLIPAGGGGGASEQGHDAISSSIAGDGGDGRTVNISGFDVSYAGGGGGGLYSGCGTPGAGGLGGGGSGACASNGIAGTVNTGGGGGGANSRYNGGIGGTGIVIIRYLNISVPTVNLTIYNNTNDNIQNLYEQQVFEFKVNHSINGVGVLGSQCNYTGTALASRYYVNGGNFTLDGITVQSVLLDHIGGIVTNDAVTIKLCRNNKKKPVEIRFNGDLVTTVNKDIIPLCPLTTELTYINKSYIHLNDVNISVSCDNCGGTDTINLISFDRIGKTMNLLSRRLYGVYPITNLIYDSGYYISDDLHSFEIPGLSYLNVTCNGTTDYINYTILNVDPVAELLTITDTVSTKIFNDAINIESGDIELLGDCLGQAIISRQLNITYSNGTLINYTNENYVNLSSGLLNEDGIYNVTLFCYDNDGQSDSISKYFTMNDTETPSINWINPMFSNTSLIYSGTGLNLDITATDTNLWSFNLTCYDVLDVLKKDYYIENITSPYQYVNVTDSISNLGKGLCSLTVKDKHTLNDLKYIDLNPVVDKSNKMIGFNYKGAILNITTIEDVTDFKILKEKTKYTYEPIIKIIPSTFVYYFQCNDYLWEFYNDEYGYYFGCGDFWADANINDISFDNYKVIRINNNKVRVEIKLNDDVQDLTTKSIGIKNTITESVSFEVIESPTLENNNIDSATAFLMIGLLGLWCFLLFFAYFFNIRLLVLIIASFGAMVGFMFISFATMPFIIFMILNGVLAIISLIM